MPANRTRPFEDVYLTAARVYCAELDPFDLTSVSTADDPHFRAAVDAARAPLLAELTRVRAEAARLRVEVERLAQPAGAGHIIEFWASGWTILHPPECRAYLFDCPVSRAAETSLVYPPATAGLFECGLSLGGHLVIGEPVEAGEGRG